MKKPSDKDIQGLAGIFKLMNGNWDVRINFHYDGDGAMECDINPIYMFHNITINLKNYNKFSFDTFCEDLLHEVCHFNIGRVRFLFQEEEPDAKVLHAALGEDRLEQLYQKMVLIDEQATVKMSRALFFIFKKTPDYKKYKKLFSKYF